LLLPVADESARSVGRLISEFLPSPGTVLGLLVPTPGQNQALTGW